MKVSPAAALAFVVLWTPAVRAEESSAPGDVVLLAASIPVPSVANVLSAPLAPSESLASDATAEAAVPEASTTTESAGSEFDQFAGEFQTASSTAALKPVFDPLRGYNRVMFAVNDKFYFWVGKPLAWSFAAVTPRPVRVSVNRGYRNLGFPVRFIGCVLQFKVKRAGIELGRFLANSTLGIAGLFDPADRWFRLPPPPDEDLGQTLGKYGVGDGFPLVLPLLGPTNLRDGLMMLPAVFLSPVGYVANMPTTVGVSAGDQVNWLSLHLGEYESLKKDALDPYTFMRDAYKQLRDKKIKD
ncbi:MAG TPA: hypothetical protein DD417_11490 [Elusimicrobia bacterium]|nr:hypothetical protein [Elusimicrobiota bacterium]